MALPLASMAISAGGNLLNRALDSGEKDYERLLAQMLAEQQSIQAPQLDAFNFTPEDVQYKTVTEDPTYKARQMALLDRMAQLGETGLSDADKASYAQGTQMANQAARQRSGALMNEMRARGQGGSGLEYALREQAGQEALTRQANQGLAQAGDSARQRALYQQAYGNELAGQRKQDVGTQAANVDVINKFNQLNTGARNAAQLENMERQNQVAQQNYQNQLSRLSGKQSLQGMQMGNLKARDAAEKDSNQKLTNIAGMGLQSLWA